MAQVIVCEDLRDKLSIDLSGASEASLWFSASLVLSALSEYFTFRVRPGSLIIIRVFTVAFKRRKRRLSDDFGG
jgi:hypothetical protein